MGLACCVLIFLFVKDELTYDTFHKNSHDIYRMIRTETSDGEVIEEWSSTGCLLAPEMKKTFPEVIAATRIMSSDYNATYRDQSFSESVMFTDPDFFEMFSFPLIVGDRSNVLDNPSSMVITPEIAEKYFGEKNPIGEILTLAIEGNQYQFTVSGIIEKPPSNSSIKYNIIIHADHLKNALPEGIQNSWTNIILNTLIQFQPGIDIEKFEDNIAEHFKSIIREADIGFSLEYKLQSLTDIHLNTEFSGIDDSSSDPVYSYILSAIAIAVLLIACINFTTLTVGRSSSRTREVGIRKVLGARKSQLTWQFLGESLLMSLASIIVGLLLAELLLPLFNNLAQKELELNLFSDPLLVTFFVILMLITAVLTGSYPALILSRLYPVHTVQGELKMKGGNRFIQGLVALQFILSIFLILSTLIIIRQIQYVQKAGLGFDKDFILSIPISAELGESQRIMNRLRNEFSGNPDIVELSGSAFGFGESWLFVNFGNEEGPQVLIGENISSSQGFAEYVGVENSYVYTNYVDENFLQTMDIEIIEGRNFSKDYPSDKENAIIINETAAKSMGWDEPIGMSFPRVFRNKSVIGVCKDFNYYALHREIEPLVLGLTREGFLSQITQIIVRIRPGNISNTIASIRDTWNDVTNGMPFNYTFLDETIAEQYIAEQRWRKIVQTSSVFSVFIACLGLFGLTSLAVAKRTKEICIRKVLGATVTNIIALLSRDFLLIVLISNIIAAPISYLVMKRWLEGFTYKADISIELFALTIIATLMLALLTVIYQALRAALADPSKSLRYE